MKTAYHADDKLVERLIALSTGAEEAPLDAAAFRRRFVQEIEGWPGSIEQAILGGALADRVAYAFMVGYQSALKQLFPTLRSADAGKGDFGSFCVTEEAGNSPKVMETRLLQIDDGWRLEGTKTFVTGGDQADILYVLACVGVEDDGRKKFCMVEVAKETPGVTIEDLPELPFVPEVSHGIVTFEGVLIDPAQRWPGDGYTGYVKPFRTVEDLHVIAALLGYVASRAVATTWPRALVEPLLALLLGHRGLAQMPATSPALHLALAGHRRLCEELFVTLESAWEEHDPAQYQRWVRDRQLLKIAASARKKRTTLAWEQLLP